MKPAGSLKFRLMVAFAKLTPTCQEMSRLSSASLERELSLIERVGMRMHFLICSWCRRYLAQLRFLRSAARQAEAAGSPEPAALGVHTLPPAARDRLKERLRRPDGEVGTDQSGSKS